MRTASRLLAAYEDLVGGFEVEDLGVDAVIAQLLERYEGLVALLTDGFLREDKHFLTIAIGCTGGRHRSVAMSEAFAERLRAHGVRTLVVHRDLGRE
jgi:RNase adaptor protein for sRNA GlmZ degradation